MNNTSILTYPALIFRPSIIRRKLNFNFFRALIFLLIGVLTILYIFQVNSIIPKTYLIKDYEREFTILSEDNKNLGIGLAQVSALENVELAIKDLNYEKIGEIRYIQLIEPQVVAK